MDFGNTKYDAASVFCRGFISLEGKSYVLEPSADHSDGTHWIYTAAHLNLTPGTCGHGFNVSYPAEHANSSPFRAFGTRVRTVKLDPLSPPDTHKLCPC